MRFSGPAYALLGLLLLSTAAPARADRTLDLIRALSDPSWRVRLQAAVVLGKLRDTRAVPWLIRALSDPDENVRAVAITALVEIGDKDMIRSIERLRSDPSPMVRARVLAGIAKLQTPPPAVAVPHKAVFIAVGGIGSKAKKTPPEMTNKLRELITRELARSPGVTLEGKPLSGFLIDSSITVMNKRVTPEWVEYTC